MVPPVDTCIYYRHAWQSKPYAWALPMFVLRGDLSYVVHIHRQQTPVVMLKRCVKIETFSSNSNPAVIRIEFLWRRFVLFASSGSTCISPRPGMVSGTVDSNGMLC